MELPLTTKNVSFRTAYLMAKLLEYCYHLFPAREPPLTCYTVGLLAKSMTLDITKAKQELGYAPKVSIDEGIDRFASWWRGQ